MESARTQERSANRRSGERKNVVPRISTLRALLTSAALGVGGFAARLGDGEAADVLGGSGVDADSVAEVGVGDSLLHGDTETLSDLAGVGAEVVDANDLVTGLVDNYLAKARVFRPALGERPLQRVERAVVHFHLTLAQGFLGLFL